MIISASYKTDVPAFYGDWFMNRLRAGSATVTNPWAGKPFVVDLRPEAVDGFVLWTRNVEPFERHLPELTARAPVMVQYTVLGYPRALDLSVIAPERSVAAIHRLAERLGPRAVVWRYDPIVVSDLTPPAWHEENVGRLAEALKGAVDECVVSFAQVYRKTARNMAAASRAFRFTWHDPRNAEKQDMLRRLAPIVGAQGMTLSLCAQRDLLVEGVQDARCVDAERLGVKAARKPHRKGCGCWQSRDIGAYGTCPHGCAYCYAVERRTRAKAAYRGHDPEADSLDPRALPSGSRKGSRTP